MKTYHRRSTISRHTFGPGGSGSSNIIDREVTRNCPLWATDRIRGLVELSCHIEVVDRGLATIDTIKAD